MSLSRVVAAVEIGTSKVAVLLGEIIDHSGLNIIAHCVGSSKGVKKGEIHNLDQASDCVHAAILKAEHDARTKVGEVYLSMTGRHLRGDFNLGSSNISAADGVVTMEDMETAKQDAKRRTLPKGRTYIHHIQNPFRLDGRVVDSPLRKQGRQLQVGYWSVHADSGAVSDSMRIIHGFDLEVSDVILSSIASGAVLLEDSEKDNGALVIDIGGGATDFVLYRKGYIVHTGVVPVGGDHITNDLSVGLRVPRKNAEALKLREASAVVAPKDREERVWLIGDMSIGDRQTQRAAINKITEARVSETFGIIKAQLSEAGLFEPSEIASGVILTGGGSRLAGLTESAEACFGLAAVRAEGPPDVASELRAPEYSTVLGLLHYALTAESDARRASGGQGLLRKLSGLLSLD
jgi:cell division protein FtsA